MNKMIFGLGVAGLIFAGYLSGVKFFSSVCAFGESCPYFLGYPACYYGLAMYFLITTIALLLVVKKIDQLLGIKLILLVSFLGILFAGYFTILELPLMFDQGLSAYFLVLPTCALGLIFYLLIFALSIKQIKK